MFCREYLIDFNATQAAIRAGYNPKAAYASGYDNLKKPQIKKRIEYLKNNIAEALNISAITIAAEHKKLAFVNGGQVWKDWLTLQEFEDLPETVKAAINEVSTKKTSRIIQAGEVVIDTFIKVKLYDKQKSLDSLAKMIGVAEPKADTPPLPQTTKPAADFLAIDPSQLDMPDISHLTHNGITKNEPAE